MLNPLSPAKREDLVRWPPKTYQFKSQLRKEEQGENGYQYDGDKLRGLYPEIANLDSASLVRAWNDYGECTSWAASPLPSSRDEYFLAYLYLQQEMGIDHGGLDEFDSAWRELGK